VDEVRKNMESGTCALLKERFPGHYFWIIMSSKKRDLVVDGSMPGIQWEVAEEPNVSLLEGVVTSFVDQISPLLQTYISFKEKKRDV